MQMPRSAAHTCGEFRSASEHAATVAMPSLRAARTACSAISPRLAIRIRFIATWLRVAHLAEQKIILQYSFFQFLIICMAAIEHLGPQGNLSGSRRKLAGGANRSFSQQGTAGGSALKVFAVLECIAAAQRPLAISELAVLLGVPKPTLHRIA